MTKEINIIGAGGHSKVVEDICELNEIKILSLVENDTEFVESGDKKTPLANGIGGVKDTEIRKKVFENYKNSGFCFMTLIHPSAIVSTTAELGEGVIIFAGAIVQPGANLGVNVLINTGAQVDHDCTIGNHVHVAPGAVLSGEVEVGEGSFVGMGARVIQGIKVGKGCLIAAGAVVVKDVQDGAKVLGVPAREV
jgi:UDP-perosamine 4-acetyltransferase